MLRALHKYLLCASKSKKNIEFNFKLPPTSVEDTPISKQQLNQKVVMVKLRRKKQNQLLKKAEPVYDTDKQTDTNMQKEYDKKIEQKLESNFATHKFYANQLNRGEDLIDDIPINPYYQYKLEDIKESAKERKKEFEEFIKMEKVVESQKLQNFKKRLEGYQNSKHRYELEQFERNLSKYPGSPKGKHPQEDPQAYAEYIHKIIPQWLVAEMEQLTGEKATTSYQGTEEQTSYSAHISDYMAGKRNFHFPKDEQQTSEVMSQHMETDLPNYKNIMPYSPIPYSPQVDFEQYHSHFFKCRLWSDFRLMYQLNEYDKKKQKLTKIIDEIYKTHKAQGTHDKIQLQPKAFSLFTYYKSLPKEIQQNPAVRTVYLGLEYSQPDVTYEEKEQALNKAAEMSLPLDKFSDAAMTDLIEKKKYYLTPHLVDRIFNIHPQFTWDIHQFLKEVKEEKLRSISTVKEKEESFPEPPQTQHEWQEGMAVLPVDYYDNDDGFWDEYLDQKLQQYEAVQPTNMKKKIHFIH